MIKVLSIVWIISTTFFKLLNPSSLYYSPPSSRSPTTWSIKSLGKSFSHKNDFFITPIHAGMGIFLKKGKFEFLWGKGNSCNIFLDEVVRDVSYLDRKLEGQPLPNYPHPSVWSRPWLFTVVVTWPYMPPKWSLCHARPWEGSLVWRL